MERLQRNIIENYFLVGAEESSFVGGVDKEPVSDRRGRGVGCVGCFYLVCLFLCVFFVVVVFSNVCKFVFCVCVCFLFFFSNVCKPCFFFCFAFRMCASSCVLFVCFAGRMC